MFSLTLLPQFILQAFVNPNKFWIVFQRSDLSARSLSENTDGYGFELFFLGVDRVDCSFGSGVIRQNQRLEFKPRKLLQLHISKSSVECCAANRSHLCSKNIQENTGNLLLQP